MTALVPNRLLFDFEFPLLYRAKMPTLTSSMKEWGDAYLLPRLSELEEKKDFGEVWGCWNENGLGIACRVKNKKQPLKCDPGKFWSGDNLRLCTDMRDARSNKRATRYCQQFYFLATGGGSKKKDSAVGTHKFKRAREDAPTVPVSQIKVSSNVTSGGYGLQAFIPASCLNGFDPSQHPRIGFYVLLEDRDHGQQYLTVGDDLYWNVDPSMWATAVLVK